MVNPKTELLTNRGLAPNLNICDEDVIQNDSANFKAALIANVANGQAMLPMHPGFEVHPYKGILRGGESKKVMIGTFPPISYLIDELNRTNPGLGLLDLLQPTPPHQRISRPGIPFFHGNVGSLWRVFLSPQELAVLDGFMPGNRQCAKAYLISVLNELGIHYDDIIKSTQRALGRILPINNLGYTYRDKDLKNICIDHDLNVETITNRRLEAVCFTNGATFGKKGLEFHRQGNLAGLVQTTMNDAFSLFLRGCQDLGLEIEMQCLPHFQWTPLGALNQTQKRTKWIFQLKVLRGRDSMKNGLEGFRQAEFTVITPFSPAAHGKIEHNPIISSFRKAHGHLPLESILRYVYKAFRNSNYDLLYPFNN